MKRMGKSCRRVVATVSAFALLVTGVVSADVTGAEAAKKPKLTKKSVTVKVGKKVTIKVKNATKRTKVKWKVAKTSIAKIAKQVKKGKKAKVVIQGKKVGNTKVTATVKVGKKNKKLTCKIKVKANSTSNASDSSATAAAASAGTSAAGASAAASAGASVAASAAASAGASAAASAAPKTDEPTVAPTEEPTAEPTEVPVDKGQPQIDLEPSSDFTMIKDSAAAADIYIDEKDSEYDGISLVAEAFKSDVARVAGIGVDEEGVAVESDKGLKVVTDSSKLSDNAIIAGTIGENGNSVINKLVADGKLDVSKLEGRWESYELCVVDNPIDGVKKGLVIAANDKRGVIFGIFHLSELMGVSPWVWWSDATPAVQSDVTFDKKDVSMISREPSVKYRGIFLNDEAPSLTNWTKERYGGRNERFYKQVYELILRLNANYLWPAMWSDNFSKDGEETPLANAELADKYGIVMGTSHHEPCYRAGGEWGSEYYHYKGDLKQSAGVAWNRYRIPGTDKYLAGINTAIENFWEDGIKRNKDFEGICTVGMRGENDSSLAVASDPVVYSEFLDYVINQQNSLKEKNNDTNPTQLVIYKEVEDAWYAGDLYNKDCMKNTIAMFCDDNWSYMRTLPSYEQQNKVAGLGMYYHFDYVGAPKSYTWIQTNQLSKVWDQMTVAYDHAVDDVWVVNVGDLKPMEMNISYFLDLAYDYSQWGIDGADKIKEYEIQWINEQLGQNGKGLNDAQLAEASQLIRDYLDLETSRKVEHVLYNKADSCSDMFSLDNYSEAQDILMKCDSIIKRTKDLNKNVPEELKAAFFQLVYYPAIATSNVLKIETYAALNLKYQKLGLSVANTYYYLCKEALELDQELYNQYNNEMPGAPEGGKKWKGMMSSGSLPYHVGMTTWQNNSGGSPNIETSEVIEANGLMVMTEGITDSFNKIYTDGTAVLPTFTSTNKEVYTIELVNKGTSYDYTASTKQDWINLSSTSGTVDFMKAIQVSIDWSKVKENSVGTIEITDGTNTVTVEVAADVIDETGIDKGTYIMANGYAVIDVANFVNSKDGKGTKNDGSESDNKMIVVEDNGKYLSSVRTTSSTSTYEKDDLDKAPYVEYKVYVPKDGTYQITSMFNPTCNLEYGNAQLRYGLSIDGGDTIITNTLVEDYLGGSYKQGTWATDIEKNDRSSVVSNVKLTKGTHTIRYYQCDANMGLIRMIVSADKLATCYGAPAESYYVGKKVDSEARKNAKLHLYAFTEAK